MVEFQPSGWSRGSYLNVGCMWLWHGEDHLSFDQGYRVENFVAIHDTDQFGGAAAKLASRAAAEVQRYRLLFPNIQCVYEFLLKQPLLNPGHWRSFHSGVACAMMGQPSEAVSFFDHFIAREVKFERTDATLAAQADAENLIALAANTREFRAVIADRVLRRRELLKLPTVTAVDFDSPFDSTRM